MIVLIMRMFSTVRVLVMLTMVMLMMLRIGVAMFAVVGVLAFAMQVFGLFLALRALLGLSGQGRIGTCVLDDFALDALAIAAAA